MRTIRIIALFVVLALASEGAGASSASAAPKKLDLYYNLYFLGDPFEQQVPIGAFFNPGVATGVKFETSVGSISCPTQTSGPIGEVVTNNEPKDNVAILDGTLVSGKCPSTVGLGTEAHVELGPGLEPTLYLGANLKAELKTSYAEYPPGLIVYFSGGATCRYKATKLKATLTLEPVTLNFTKQKFKSVKAESNLSCPKTMAFSGAFETVSVTAGNRLYGQLD
jgi:hypothetical protein